MSSHVGVELSPSTLIKRVESTATAKNISTGNANNNSNAANGEPHAQRVANQVNLLASVVLGPERDSLDEKRPLDGSALVRVRSCQSSVM